MIRLTKLLAATLVSLYPLWAVAGTVELQADIGRNWEAIEALRGQSAALGDRYREVAAVAQKKVDDARAALGSARLGSAGHAEARTNLIEGLGKLHMARFEAWRDQAQLLDRMIDRILTVEEQVASMGEREKLAGARGDAARRKELLEVIDRGIEEQARRGDFVEEIAAASPETRERIHTSSRFMKAAWGLARDALSSGGGKGAQVWGKNGAIAFNSRASFETMRARYRSGLAHEREILGAIRASAELVNASLLGALIHRTTGDILGSLGSLDRDDPLGRGGDWSNVREITHGVDVDLFNQGEDF